MSDILPRHCSADNDDRGILTRPEYRQPHLLAAASGYQGKDDHDFVSAVDSRRTTAVDRPVIIYRGVWRMPLGVSHNRASARTLSRRGMNVVQTIPRTRCFAAVARRSCLREIGRRSPVRPPSVAPCSRTSGSFVTSAPVAQAQYCDTPQDRDRLAASRVPGGFRPRFRTSRLEWDL